MMEEIWQKADELVEEIKKYEPEFGKCKVSIVDFGAVTCGQDISKGHGSANQTVINEHNNACNTAYNYAKTKWPTLCK